MKLSKFCEEHLINFNLQGKTKSEVIEELVELASQSKLVKDKEELLKDIITRENLVTTGVGYGVAFPHAKTKATRALSLLSGARTRGSILKQWIGNLCICSS